MNRGIEVLQTYALPLGYVAKMPEHIRHFDLWLGYKDSNLGIPESESGALPLGDTPTALKYFTTILLKRKGVFKKKWGGW